MKIAKIWAPFLALVEGRRLSVIGSQRGSPSSRQQIVHGSKLLYPTHDCRRSKIILLGVRWSVGVGLSSNRPMEWWRLHRYACLPFSTNALGWKWHCFFMRQSNKVIWIIMTNRVHRSTIVFVVYSFMAMVCVFAPPSTKTFVLIHCHRLRLSFCVLRWRFIRVGGRDFGALHGWHTTHSVDQTRFIPHLRQNKNGCCLDETTGRNDDNGVSKMKPTVQLILTSTCFLIL